MKINRILIVFFLFNQAASASSAEILDHYAIEAKKENQNFKGFSAIEGKKIYFHKGNKQTSCQTCHTPDPRAQGKTRANKVLEPLSPHANPKRFTKLSKVEKWFRRNCDDAFERPCTIQEKGDFLTYVLTFK